MLPTIGEFVSVGMPIARVAGCPLDPALVRELRHALLIEEQRDIGCDAAYSVDHLVNIAWTAISTAKSNPAVGMAACQALGDIVYRWLDDGAATQRAAVPVRYRDTTVQSLLDGMASLVVVASESMQHQTLATIVAALADALCHRARSDRQDPADLAARPGRPSADPPARTGDDRRRAQALAADGRTVAAAQLAVAWATLAGQCGTIKSRGNRDQTHAAD